MSEHLQVTASFAALAAACAWAVVLLWADDAPSPGRCRIRINGDLKALDVRPGLSLLNALRTGGISLPTACGGRGMCGLCKVKVLSGGGPMQPAETGLLKDDERKAGMRLACQVRVRGDVSLEIPGHLLLPKQYLGAVERIRDLNHDIKELRIRLKEPNTLLFTAGQYVQLETPSRGEAAGAVCRAYSISSPPAERHVVELIIRLVPGGICTTWVFTTLREGDDLRFNGPYGEFALSDSDRPMVWIAGGSGMAPFWGMIRHMKHAGTRRPVTYFFGALSKRDLCLVEEFRALEMEMPGLRFIPALSQPRLEDNWDGERGLITEVVDRNIADATNAEFYLCGSGGMIDAAVKVIRGKGVTDDRIFYDKFT